MTRLQIVGELFEQAIELHSQEREAFLEAACGDDVELLKECLALLEADEAADDFLERPAAELYSSLLSRGTSEPAADEPVSGLKAGPYRIIEEIGRGGMGTVFAAERADGEFDRAVALKLIRRGLDTDEILERFLLERQLLARLDHPNIARLLDGGSTGDGRPYLVMERVDGMAIDQYCSSHALRVRERLELFVQILDAVAFAHRNLVLHRDLKPSNILVTRERQVKLLDFGIASLLDSSGRARTSAERRPMTPEYAAPEQLAGEAITTATDVYSLGLLLALLLCGDHPQRRESAATTDVFRFRPSTRASRLSTAEASQWGMDPTKLSRVLAGDLDSIVQMTLRERPEDRYSGVGALRSDIVAYLSQKPISARPQTLRYVVSRYVSRHRRVTAALVALLLAIGLGLAGTLWQARRASLEAERAERVGDLLVRTFQGADPEVARGETITARELLDEGARTLEVELVNQPLERAELQLVIAGIYRSLGSYDRADTMLDQALSALAGRPVEDSQLAVRFARELGTLRTEQGRFDEAIEAFEQALSQQPRDKSEQAELLHGLGVARREAGLFEQARNSLERAQAIYSAAAERDDDPHSQAHQRATDVGKDLADLDFEAGNLEAALDRYRSVLTSRREIYGQPSVQVATSTGDLGVALADSSDLDLAVEHLEESLAMRRALFPGGHPSIAHGLRNLAGAERRRGNLSRAEELYSESLSLYRETLGESHPEVGMALNNLAVLRSEQGDNAEAAELLSEAVRISRSSLGDRHPDLVPQIMSLAVTYSRAGSHDAALTLAQEAVELASQVLPEGHPLRGVTQLNLGQIHQAMGNLEQARRLFESAIEELGSALGEQHPNTALAMAGLAGLEERLGNSAQAVELYRQALVALRAGLPAGHLRIADTATALAQAWHTLEPTPAEQQEIRQLIEEAVEIYQSSLGEDDPRTQKARAVLSP